MTNKIILFGPYPPPYGGVAIYLYTLYEFLKKFNFNCDLKIYKQSDDSSRKFIQPEFRSIYFHFYKTKKDDVCVDSCSFFLEYPSSIKPILVWLLIKVVKKFRWIKIIHDGTLPSRYETFGTFKKFLFNLSIRFVDEFIVVSEGLRRWLKNNIKVKQKVSLIKSLLPIPPDNFNVSIPIEIEQSISQYSKLICAIGVFLPDYGFRQIADAVEAIRQESGLNIGLVFVDGAFAGDEDYKSAIIQNREWITVLSNIPHAQVLQILKRSNVFVRGVAFESYGLSRVEALWCGIPVVATRAGETRGMLLYDYGDEKELIRQIKKALFNPSLLDISIWAELFRQEAEDNLQALVRVINPNREIRFD